MRRIRKAVAVVGIGAGGAIAGWTGGSLIGAGESYTHSAEAKNMLYCADIMKSDPKSAAYICGLAYPGWKYERFSADAEVYAKDITDDANELNKHASEEDHSVEGGRTGMAVGTVLALGIGVVAYSIRQLLPHPTVEEPAQPAALVA